MSLREIAEQLGVSHVTVKNDIDIELGKRPVPGRSGYRVNTVNGAPPVSEPEPVLPPEVQAALDAAPVSSDGPQAANKLEDVDTVMKHLDILYGVILGVAKGGNFQAMRLASDILHKRADLLLSKKFCEGHVELAEAEDWLSHQFEVWRRTMRGPFLRKVSQTFGIDAHEVEALLTAAFDDVARELEAQHESAAA